MPHNLCIYYIMYSGVGRTDYSSGRRNSCLTGGEKHKEALLSLLAARRYVYVFDDISYARAFVLPEDHVDVGMSLFSVY